MHKRRFLVVLQICSIFDAELLNDRDLVADTAIHQSLNDGLSEVFTDRSRLEFGVNK